jgi:hypothetical protein
MLVYEKHGDLPAAAKRAIEEFHRRTGNDATEIVINPKHSEDFSTGEFNGVQVKLSDTVPLNNVMAGRSSMSPDDFKVSRR